MNLDQIEVNVEETSKISSKVKISVPPSVVSSEVQNKITETAKKANLKGFRPGKAPREMIEQIYGPSIQSDVLNTLSERALSLVISDRNLDVVSIRDVAFEHSDIEKGISYTAELALYPDPEVSDIQETEIEVKEVVVDDEDVETTIRNLQETYAEFTEPAFRDEAKKGDLLELALTINEEGSEPEGAPERSPIRLGEGRLPKEVEDILIGAKVGDTKEVDVSVNDKTFHYKVVVEGIKEPKLSELNDEFAQKVNPQLKTMLELRMDARKYLEEESKKITTNIEEAEIFKHLRSTFQFDVPVEMVEKEVRFALEQARIIKNDDPMPPLKDDLKERLFKEAEERVKAAVLISAFTKQFDVKVDDSDLDSYLKDMAGGDESQIPTMKQIISERPEVQRQVLAQILQGKTVSLMKEKFKFKKSPVSFHAFNKKENPSEEAQV